ncbi:hypothetical protein MHBO_001717 [Bonamia ostreae]|uniref:Uncharacterized protein n=1 Tax=Bonamia ostreae TaxID=126728 RepID=A0ABV2AJX0_9EUKA
MSTEFSVKNKNLYEILTNTPAPNQTFQKFLSEIILQKRKTSWDVMDFNVSFFGKYFEFLNLYSNSVIVNTAFEFLSQVEYLFCLFGGFIKYLRNKNRIRSSM